MAFKGPYSSLFLNSKSQSGLNLKIFLPVLFPHQQITHPAPASHHKPGEVTQAAVGTLCRTDAEDRRPASRPVQERQEPCLAGTLNLPQSDSSTPRLLPTPELADKI